jgi:hypothetical protein
MNREFVRDWKGSTCGLFQSAVTVCTGKSKNKFMLVRSLPEVVKFVDCAQVHYGST